MLQANKTENKILKFKIIPKRYCFLFTNCLLCKDDARVLHGSGCTSSPSRPEPEIFKPETEAKEN